MNKYSKLLLCAALGLATFTACEDVPAPYNIPSDNPTPVVPTADYVINQSFTSSLGDFQSQSESGTLAWAANSKYGAIITGYNDFDGDGQKENKPGVTYLNSPEIDLTGVDSAYVVIDQAINYAKETLADDHHLLIRVGEGEWAELPMDFDGLGNSFNYITQNIQIPQEYMGKKIQLALKHVAHDSYSSTWEVKSLSVAKGTAPSTEARVIEGGVGSGTKDDPYDVATTIKLIAAGAPSEKIYTKGIVCEVDESSFDSKYGSLIYYISDDGSQKDKLEVYRGYGLGGAKFGAADGLKVGDEVIVYGQVVYYNNKTMEFTQGSELYSLNGVTAGGGVSPVGIEVTCAEAVELTKALADGATSEETYTVTGYITQVVGAVSRNQQTFWMADTKDGGKVFEAYYANLPEGVSEFKVGTKVKITGQLIKYVKNDQITPEIKNATVEILEDGGDTPTPTGIEVTCAQAVELTNALADGGTSSETYTVTGYITEVVGNVSRNQQTFWMADTKDGGKLFEAYYANLPEGVSEFKVGSKVKITGQLMKYVKDGKVTPEIKNATVEILENGGDTPTPSGTEVTCAQAVELTKALADGATSSEIYTVKGYITEVVGNVSRNQQTFWMADTKDGGKVFEAYWANLPDGVSAFTVGSLVKITGQLTKYVKDGNVTPEIKNATVEILEGGGDPQPGGDIKTLSDFANGNFETWADGVPTGWKSASTASNATLSQSTDAHGGSYSVKVGGASQNKRLAYEELQLEAGTYAVSFYAKAATDDGGSVNPGYVPIKDDGSVGSYVYGGYVNDLKASEWVKVDYEFTLSAKTTICLVVMNSKNPGKDVLIDDYTITKK